MSQNVSKKAFVEVLEAMCGHADGGRATRVRNRRVEFYWCVPDTEKFRGFKTRIPKTSEILGEGLSHVNLHEHVLFLKPTALKEGGKRKREVSVMFKDTQYSINLNI